MLFPLRPFRNKNVNKYILEYNAPPVGQFMHQIKLLFLLPIGNRDYNKTLPFDGWSREKILNEIDDLIDLGKFQFEKYESKYAENYM